jgi:hypothetical protein
MEAYQANLKASRSKSFASLERFFFILYQKNMFKILAYLKLITLPSFTKQGLDLSKAKKWQMVLLVTLLRVTPELLIILDSRKYIFIFFLFHLKKLTPLKI